MGRTILEFYPFDFDYSASRDGKTVLKIYGTTKEGKKVLIKDYSLNPYFYVIINPEKTAEALDYALKIKGMNEEREVTVLSVDVVKKKLKGKDVTAIKIEVPQPSDISAIKDEVKRMPGYIERAEIDIKFYRRYLIDKQITPLTLMRASGEIEENPKYNVDYVVRADEITIVSEDTIEHPKVIAFDIETYNPSGNPTSGVNPIIMISFAGSNGVKKLITWKQFENAPEYVEFVESERELLEHVKHFLKSEKPDIITGYNSDNFDLPYIISRANKYKVKMNIGADGTELKLMKQGIGYVGMIRGMVHVDLFTFIKNTLAPTMRTESFSLNEVAKELVGEAKMEGVGWEDMHKMWDAGGDGVKKLAEYNMQDSNLTLKLFNRVSNILFELTKLVKQPLFDVSRLTYGKCVEWYLAGRAQRFNELIPGRPYSTTAWMKSYEGAFVLEPKPGVYKNIIVYDFRSLYPSIIISHNICPTTLSCSCCKEGYVTPEINGKTYSFCKKKQGFISHAIEDLVNRRARIKEILKSVDKTDRDYRILSGRSYALKTVANAMYGYLGFSKSRWYSLECAASITAWGRYHIKSVIEEAEKEGFEVVYGDSLPYDRHIFLKFENGDIKLVKIGELYDNYRNEHNLATLSFENGNSVFKPIKQIIRHKYDGELLKIATQYGSTIVTPQHSVYSFKDGIELVDAKKLKKGDKLVSLTNPKVDETYKDGHVFDIVDLNLGEYKNDFVLYSDNVIFNHVKGICPYCKKNVFLSTHIYRYHKDRRQNLNEGSNFSWFGVKHGKGRRIPRYWVLDKDLAWLLGFYCAEGSVSDCLTKSGKKCLLSFGGQDERNIKRVKEILDAKTGIATEIIKDYDSRINKYMFYYRVQCLPVVSLFKNGFDAGKGSEFKKVPWFIFTAEESLRRAFVKGYLDGDGCSHKEKRYKTHFIRFSTKSKELAEGLCFLLKMFKPEKNAWRREIKHVYWNYRTDKPKIQSLRLQSAKESKGNFCLGEIKSIQHLPNEPYVYDIEVEGAHNFVDAEGMILVHNTDSIMIHLKEKSIEDSKKFVERINKKLPHGMELEYQGFYLKGIFVAKKSGEGEGAKKRYALVDEKGEITIKGFEFVRRNVSRIAKDTQMAVLKAILIDGSDDKALQLIKGSLERLKSGKAEAEEVTIYTQLTRKVEHYDSVGPHVAAVIKAQGEGAKFEPGQIIKYIITKGEGSISDRAYLVRDFKEKKLEYDPEYYINNQLLPAVGRIFEVLGYSKDALQGKMQTTLGGFLKSKKK